MPRKEYGFEKNPYQTNSLWQQHKDHEDEIEQLDDTIKMVNIAFHLSSPLREFENLIISLAFSFFDDLFISQDLWRSTLFFVMGL